MIYLKEQLVFLHFIQQWSSPYLDLFFCLLNFFDSQWYELLLVVFLWLVVSRQWAIRVAYLLLFNDMINYASKQIWQMPRPFYFDERLAFVSTSTSYGFPSGGTQLSTLLGLLFMCYCTWRWAWLLGSLYILLISFSRMFLGVHFPLDILGGWALAAFVFALFLLWGDKIETFANTHPGESLARSVAVILVMVLLAPYQNVCILAVYGVLIGSTLYLLRCWQQCQKSITFEKT
ncbi:MAG: phosphatase PAP2 family protein [Waddliaceae bacterium]